MRISQENHVLRSISGDSGVSASRLNFKVSNVNRGSKSKIQRKVSIRMSIPAHGPAVWRELLLFGFHCLSVFRAGLPDWDESKLVWDSKVPTLTSRNLDTQLDLTSMATLAHLTQSEVRKLTFPRGIQGCFGSLEKSVHRSLPCLQGEPRTSTYILQWTNRYSIASAVPLPPP